MAGVYISYPFCGQKCTFCNFASGVFPAALAEKYLKALGAEIRSHAWRWRPETLYLGGGSPGNLEAGKLEALLTEVPGRPWTEATIEAPPGCVTPEKAERWIAAGLTRVSLGVQSFVLGELARTGRRHTANTAAGDVGLLRSAGIGNFNIDLIAGLPGQTPASWRESLEWVDRLEAPHVSVYMLEVDHDSRLGEEILAGGSRYGAAEAPDEDVTAGLYEAAVDYLASIGLARYEISNFARPGFQSRHNLKYWRLEPYAGFGADAHSFDGLARSQNVESPSEYVSRYETSETPVVSRVPARLAEERLFLGLRLDAGIVPNSSEWERHDSAFRRFAAAGLIESDGASLRLTRRGVLMSNEVFQEFLEG